LPEFSDFPDNEFFDELDRYDDNDDEYCQRIDSRRYDNEFSDSETDDNYENDYDSDFDDRRHGPEDTIEDL